MNYDQAKAIAASHAPSLVVDPPVKDHPSLLVVRKSKDAPPFSIHLSTLTGDMAAGKTADEITAAETTLLTGALDAALS